MPIDPGQFRLAMSHFASGITIVTTEHEGALYGMTVASFASLSLDPPLVLVCIEKNVTAHDAIGAAGRFAVSILGEAQSDISNRFATKGIDRFEGVATSRGPLGLPLIGGAICTVECTLRDTLPGGDHTIYVGEVESAESTGGTPLVYFRSGYRRLEVQPGQS